MTDTIRARWNVWSVHPLCRSGHHEMCKQYEEWNWRAMFICGCEECDHPKPTREQFEAHELKVYGRIRDHREKAPDELDASSSVDVASWFVQDDDPQDTDGHEEAHEPETTMSATEAVTAEQVEDEGVEDDAIAPPVVDAPDSDATADDPDGPEDDEGDDAPDDETPKRARGQLEQEVKGITDKFRSGKIKLPDDKELTPHYIALAIEKAFGYDEPPSTGAVAAVLKRWDQYGYATFGEDPFHFTGLTEDGEAHGLATLRENFKEARKEERRKEREAKAAAKSEDSDDTEVDSDEE